MRDNFKTGRITEIFYRGYIVTLTDMDCFLVCEAETGWVQYESSNIAEWSEVRQYIDNTTKF